MPSIRLADRVITRLLRLPPPTNAFTVTRDVVVPMRDGIDLLADHYAPSTTTPAGTILIRGPYGRGPLAAFQTVRAFASRGYHVILQSVRGTFGSGGEFEPGRREVEDGADTVAWLRAQPWFTGRFATMGGSYLGFTQWAMLADPPPELAAAVISVGPHDISDAVWGTGSFLLGDFLGWSDLVARQEDGRFKPFIVGLAGRWRVDPALRALPLGDAAKSLLGETAPWYQSWVAHPDTTAEYWHPTQLRSALDKVDVPIRLITGWQDLFLEQTLYQFRHLRARGVDVGLTVGPWTHGQIGLGGAGQTTRESLDWLAEHLAQTHSRARRDRVRIFVTGAQEWRDLAHWPPEYDTKVLYLHPDSTLSKQAPAPRASSSQFVYNPADPTPTIGGRLLSTAAGYRNDARLAKRGDVLSFTGPALTEDLEVIGTPFVELVHSTDIPYADVWVRVSDVDPKGRSRNVSDGYVRLPSDRAQPLRLDLDAIAHRFGAGHRIRLLIAGGSHPRYARNLGTGEPPLTGSRLKPSTHTIAHGSSRLVLPV
ncbi:CocE/NonD family hydrolase [Mycobacterium sp. OAE908]|uniref:CocE/NonD family hydrolase n=1 Tax=Mycobacterium sp. OAE908 TaxID=2817899 RepID=UPI001AE9A9B0